MILKYLSESFKLLGKKIIVFIVNDFEFKYKRSPNLILLRTSLRASKQRHSEFPLPYLWENIQHPFAPLVDDEKPFIGFCGYVSKHRKKFIKIFEQSSEVRCDFIKREDFWGGKPNAPRLIAELMII